MENKEAILQLNNLAVLLHRAISINEGNVFISPISVTAALAMLQCGASGKAAQELQALIGNDGKILRELLCHPPHSCTIANAIFTQKHFGINHTYQNELETNFMAQIMPIDFQNDNECAVNEINKWAEEKTNGTIPRLIESVDKETVLILLNAVYYKGTWTQKFDKQKTTEQIFYCKGSKDSSKLINMMHTKGEFPYAEEDNFLALKLPYEGDEVFMIIFLPSSNNDLQKLEKQIKSSFIHDLEESWRKRQVEVSLPKFRVEYSTNFNGVLKNMGIQKIFECNSELSGISDCTQLRVSEVHQKAVLVVDEEGCEAAAVTAIRLQKRSVPKIKEFVVDRPFLFVIGDARNNLVLFMGRIEEL